MDNEGCQEWTLPHQAHSTHSTRCNKKVVEVVDGKPLCRRHLSGLRTKQATDAAYKLAKDGSDANLERATQACEILKELGIEAGPYYFGLGAYGDFGYTGRIIVDPADLFRALGIGSQLPEIREYRKQ